MKDEKKQKHTPGPWGREIWTVEDGHVLSRISLRTKPSEPEIVVAVLQSYGTPEIPPKEVRANTFLISAAPDLLEACKQIKAAYAHLTPYEHGEEAEKALDAIDAALAKAEGREA